MDIAMDWVTNYLHGFQKHNHMNSKNALKKFLYDAEKAQGNLDLSKCAHVVCYFNLLMTKGVQPWVKTESSLWE